MAGVLNIISVSAAFIFGAGLIYIVLDSTIGRIKFLRSKFEWHGLQVKDFVFFGISIIVLLTCCSFIKPY